jgi:hypothetical protein
MFPVLKDGKSFKIQAKDQAVSEVLDDSYISIPPDNVALFQENQKYLYTVLESKVLTDTGKALIWDHEHDLDAQKVYQKLKAYHVQSTKANM